MEIGIFQTSKLDSDGAPISFFNFNDEMLLAALYKAASHITGPGLQSYDPEPGEKVKRIGAFSAFEYVDDDSVYIVRADDSVKPEGGRMPAGENGTWTIQSLIFNKDHFDLSEAKKWVADHAGFGDYGVDETSTSYRFRQYDPKYFSEYRTITIDTGISAAYGKINKKTEQTEDDAKKLLEDSIKRWEAVHDVNKAIMERGLMVLKDSAVVRKIEKADGTEEEERFVLSLVLEPNDGDGSAPFKPDTQGDIYSEDAVRKAAHAWMEFHGAMDLNHSWKDLGKEKVRTLESYVSPVEFTCGEGDCAYKVVKGTWMLGVRIVDDALWKAVKEGQIGAYSIGGTALREPVQ